MAKRIAVAPATGNLGNRIVSALLAQGADVVALVRKGSDEGKVRALKDLRAEVLLVDTSRVEELSKALKGAVCVVSAPRASVT